MNRKSTLLGGAIALTMACLHACPAHARPGDVELRLAPITTGANLGVSDASGFRIISPQGGRNVTIFGLGLGLGFLTSRYIEPGFSVNLSMISAGNTTTVFGLVPFLKINSWMHHRFNPFIEPFAGFSVLSNGGSSALFDGGLFVGGEILFGNLGIRIHTGFEVLAGNGHAFVFPIGWALVGYI